jgi:hypothetical protein
VIQRNFRAPLQVGLIPDLFQIRGHREKGDK